jgi:hypothetical protein
LKKGFVCILLLCILGVLSVCTGPNGFIFEYAGDQDPINLFMGSFNGVILDFKLFVGSITLELNPTTFFDYH